MEIKIINIIVDTQALTPALTISVNLEFFYYFESPISISGRLVVDNKVVSFLNEYQINSDKKFALKYFSKSERERNSREAPTSDYAQLTAMLSPNAIEHIEKTREKRQDKSVFFNIDFVVKYLEMPSILKESNAENLFWMMAKRVYKDFTINQSDWVLKYSSQLGIGNFLLLELAIPAKQQVNVTWNELYDRLTLRVTEMNEAIRVGDWQKAIDRGRQFNDNLKLNKGNRDGHQKFREEMKKLFENERHSSEGIQNFFDGISNFYDYNSKFIHDKDKNGNLNPILIPTREDAYFIYALSIGLLNLIGKKLTDD